MKPLTDRPCNSLLRMLVVTLVAVLTISFQDIPSKICLAETEPASDKTPASRSLPSKVRPKAEKSAPKKYQWLFQEKKEDRSADSVELGVLLAKLDNEIKEARRLYLSGESDKAMEAYYRALDHLDSLLDEAPYCHPLLGALDERFQVFDEVVTKVMGPLHVQPKVDLSERVFDLMERRRVFRRLLTLKKAGILEFSDVPRDLLREESEVLEKLLELKAEVSSASVRQAEESLTTTLSAIRHSLGKSSSRYALLMNRVTPKLAKIRQEILKKDEMILDLNLLPDRVVVGVITSESAAYHQIEANRSDIDRGVLNLQEMLRDFSSEARSSFMGHAWKEPARRIYRSLLGKLPPLPDGKPTVLIVPDRSLWYLPFAVMLDTDDKPFGRDRLLSCVPSVDMLRFLRSSPQPSEKTEAALELLILESIPWVAEEQIKPVASDSAVGKRTGKEISDDTGIDRLILRNPVYPKPSEIVIKVQKMFKKFNVWVGPTATYQRLAENRDGKERVAVLAVPLAVPDTVEHGRHPVFFFSADNRGRRIFDSVRLFATPMESKLAVLPIGWFEIQDSDSVTGEGPLLLSLAMLYAGNKMVLLNYSDPDWGSDEPFLLDILRKVSQRTPPGKALAEYSWEIPSGLDASFKGKPPNWVGWILIGDPS